MLTGARALDWAFFAASVLVAMVIDRLAFRGTSERIGLREATVRSVFWTGSGLAFGWLVLVRLGHARAVDYLVAYLVEKSLSVDNLFVFLVLFGYFQVKDRLQLRVLTWGILGALVMRAAFIVAGAVLLARIHWTMYVFGAFLVYSGLKLLIRDQEAVNPEKGWPMRLARRYLRTVDGFEDGRFFTLKNGKRYGTRLLLVLVLIESTDVMFAVDSVPAVLAISQDLFVVYSSNIWAILGLRALYFLLAGVMERFYYLDRALSVILAFIGIKMLSADLFKLSNLVSLGVVAALLAIAVVASIIRSHGGSGGQQT